MNIKQFRDSVKDYLRSADFTLKVLADNLGLHQQVLSRKLGGTGTAYLNHTEIKKIIQMLAEWKAISRWDQANELLNYLDCKATIFSDEEWESHPLNQLEKLAPVSQTPPPISTALTTYTTTFQLNNLPVPLTSLIGREQVVAQLGALLLKPATRLLSLIGPGGSGKTRLAIEVGRVYLNSFEQGVCFVDLAAVDDQTRVIPAIAKAIGLTTSDTTDSLQSFKDFLREQQLLLILDNFEQLTGASWVVEELLKAAPDLKIIVTTRVVLHLYGEQEFTVPTLDLPGPEMPVDSFSLYHYAAIQLFVERVKTVKPDFYLNDDNAGQIIQLCNLLNGLPLALELAASRVKLLPLPVLLERLASYKLDLLSNNSAYHIPWRQKTLRNTLDWSYNLLAPAEQQIFRELGIFRGSFSIEAVQTRLLGTGQGRTATLVIDQLQELLDNSLLTPLQTDEPGYGFSVSEGKLIGSARFKLLETIREYALEQLREQHELADLQIDYFNYYKRLVKNVRPQLNGPAQNQWLSFLDSEYANIMTIMNMVFSSLEGNSPAERQTLILAGLMMCRDLALYWDIRGFNNEASVISHHLLGCARQVGLYETPEYAWALSILGVIAGRLGDFAQSREMLEESLGLFEKFDEKSGMANALNHMGSNAQLCGDNDRALKLLSQAEELCRVMEDKSNLGRILVSASIINKTLSRFELANNQLNQALVIFQKQDNKLMIASCLHNLGATALSQLEISTALEYLNESLQMHIEQGDHRGIAYAYRSLGTIAYWKMDYTSAQNYLLDSLRLSFRIGDKYQIGMSLALLAIVNVAIFELQAVETGPAENTHFLQTAARFMGGSEAEFKAARATINSTYQNAYEEKVQTARAILGEAEFSANYSKGLTSPMNLTLKIW